eukprot:SAG31_NODE_1948_length_6834_cov_16.124276_5_plen_45_part_00
MWATKPEPTVAVVGDTTDEPVLLEEQVAQFSRGPNSEVSSNWQV